MSKMSKFSMALLAAAALGMQAQAATIIVNADIGPADETWTTGNEYQLTKPVFVVGGATLTIQPGVVVRGEQAAGVDPGALIVSRGSKIRAMGTKDNPIVFTDLLDDNIGGNPGTGNYANKNNTLTERWGGVLLLGQTYVASDDFEGGGIFSPNAAVERQIEGLVADAKAKYGGGNDNDDSGEMHYVSIRYGGFELGQSNEINGLTMGAVGRLTKIDHIEVFNNKDDGFEWFGGTVNTKFLIAAKVGDDSFDWDEGFRGKGQFWFGMQGAIGTTDVSDKGQEMDGADGDDSLPQAIPTIYNLTHVGQGKASGNLKNTPLHFRDGTGGRHFNGLFMDFGGACTLIEGAIGDGIVDAADNVQANYVQDAYHTHEAGGTKKLQIDRCAFWNMGETNPVALAAGSGIADNYGASGEDENKPHYGYPIFTNPQLNNRVLAALPIAQLSRTNVPWVISGKSYYNVDKINPILGANPLFKTGGRLPPVSDAFFSKVQYLGAFNTLNWAGPWSTIYRLDICRSAEYDAGGPVPTCLVNGDNLDKSVPAGTPVTVRAKLLADLYANTNADWWMLWVDNTGATRYYNKTTGQWILGATFSSQAAIFDFGPFTVLNANPTLGAGTHTFSFGVDLTKNGLLDAPLYQDTVTLTVTP